MNLFIRIIRSVQISLLVFFAGPELAGSKLTESTYNKEKEVPKENLSTENNEDKSKELEIEELKKRILKIREKMESDPTILNDVPDNIQTFKQLAIWEKRLAELEGFSINQEKMKKMSEISNKEFLKTFKGSERLAYITKGNIDSKKVSSGEIKNLEFTFTFDGIYNNDLYLKTTAGQVLPREVKIVRVEGQDYMRKNLGGEFFAGNKRLTIHEGTNIHIGELRTEEDLNKIEKQNNDLISSYLKENPSANKYIIEEAVKRGINLKFAEILFTDLIKGKDKDESKVILEDAMTEFDRIRGYYEISDDIDKSGKYDKQLALNLLQNFYPDNWKEKGIEYGYNKKEVEEFKNSNDFRVDFSGIETGNIKGLIERAADNLGISPKMVSSIIKIESGGRIWATRREGAHYQKYLQKYRGNSEEANKAIHSYGLFQIMGWNAEELGFRNPSEMLNYMKANVQNQFDVFTRFVKRRPDLLSAMRQDPPNYDLIAYRYNGPKYRVNDYHNKLRAAYMSSRLT